MSSTGEEPQPLPRPPTVPPTGEAEPQEPVRQLDPIDEDVDWDHLCEEAAEVARQEEEDDENAIGN